MSKETQISDRELIEEAIRMLERHIDAFRSGNVGAYDSALRAKAGLTSLLQMEKRGDIALDEARKEENSDG